MSLARLVASATHLLETEVQEPAVEHGVHASSPIKPVCTEPYCGGFWWAMDAKSPKIDPESAKVQAQEKPGSVPVDFPDVSFFPAFDPPVASSVKLLRANDGVFDRWNIPNAVTVKVGTFSEMRFLTNEVMNDFMRVQEDAGLGEPEYVVRQGLQLVSWKPRNGRLHVTPFLGSKAEMETASLPATFTFGGKPTVPKEGGMEPEIPEAPNYGNYLREQDKPKPPIVLPVKRLDFVIRKRENHHHYPMSEPLAAPPDVLAQQGGTGVPPQGSSGGASGKHDSNVGNKLPGDLTADTKTAMTEVWMAVLPAAVSAPKKRRHDFLA